MKMRNRKEGVWRRFALDQRGTQLIEMAIVLPLLLTLFVVIIDFGRFFYTYTTLAKATRLGARYASTNLFNSYYRDRAKNLVVCGQEASCAGVTPIVKNLTVNNVEVIGYECTTTCTPIPSGNPTNPDVVMVGIGGNSSYVFQPLFGGFLKFIGANLGISVKPSTTMEYLLKNPSIG